VHFHVDAARGEARPSRLPLHSGPMTMWVKVEPSSPEVQLFATQWQKEFHNLSLCWRWEDRCGACPRPVGCEGQLGKPCGNSGPIQIHGVEITQTEIEDGFASIGGVAALVLLQDLNLVCTQLHSSGTAPEDLVQTELCSRCCAWRAWSARTLPRFRSGAALLGAWLGRSFSDQQCPDRVEMEVLISTRLHRLFEVLQKAAKATEKVLVIAPTAIVCYLLWRVLCFTEPAWALTCRNHLSEAELRARLLDPKRAETGACVRIQGSMNKDELQCAEGRFKGEGKAQASVLVAPAVHLATNCAAASAAQVAEVVICFAEVPDPRLLARLNQACRVMFWEGHRATSQRADVSHSKADNLANDWSSRAWTSALQADATWSQQREAASPSGFWGVSGSPSDSGSGWCGNDASCAGTDSPWIAEVWPAALRPIPSKQEMPDQADVSRSSEASLAAPGSSAEG
jgi:hypothetical protein